MDKKTILLVAVALMIILFFATQNPLDNASTASETKATPTIQSENETVIEQQEETLQNESQATPSAGAQPTAYASEQFAFNEPNYCGDGECQPPEGCAECPTDCPCEKGEYCNQTTNVCKLKTECGDLVCDEFELIAQDCCMDCGCFKDEVCDDYTNICISAGLLPSNEEAMEIALGYLANQTKEYWVEGVGQSAYDGEAFVNVILGCESEVYACGAWITVDESWKVASISYLN